MSVPPRGDGGDGRPTDRDIQREFSREALGLEEGIHPRMSLTRMHIRVGSRFISLWWFVPGVLLVCAAMVVAFKLYYASGAPRAFLAAHPCVPRGHAGPGGFPAFVIATHVFNFFVLVMIVRAGLQILADHPRLYSKIHCTPGREWLRFRGPVPKGRLWTAKDDAITLSPLVGMPGGRHTIGVARHWHFSFDILFVVNGIAYITLLFTTGHYHLIVPTHWEILPRAGSCIITYASLHLPTGNTGYYHYDALQQLGYFAVVFVLAPITILSGLAMSPALDNRFKAYQKLFVNRQIARSVHFLCMLSFLAFYVVHMIMVAATGFSLNLERITIDANHEALDGVALFLLALGVVIVFNVGAIRFSWRHTRLLQRISNLTVGRVMDGLFDHYAPRAEYSERDISPYFWPNGLVPTSAEWTALRDGGWRDYRLKVHGLVANPVELSLADLRALGRGEQITMHNCIQGWSAIGKWSGLPFARLIELVQPDPEAAWVMFFSFGEGGEGGPYYDSHSMADLRHPQSLLAYEMNGEPLPIVHGAPLRLRVENQLGFKQVKWISEIEFVRAFSEYGSGMGGYNEDHEFYGYRDEI
jgi:thiosulfate reductase cytochrome b subunit